MATETYSLSATGALTGAPFVVSNVKIGDTAGLVPTQQLAMRQGNPIMCKNPDGSLQWYTLDAERSTAAQVVLKPM